MSDEPDWYIRGRNWGEDLKRLSELEARLARYELEKDPYAPHNKQQLDEMAGFINEQARRIRELEAENERLKLQKKGPEGP